MGAGEMVVHHLALQAPCQVEVADPVYIVMFRAVVMARIAGHNV